MRKLTLVILLLLLMGQLVKAEDEDLALVDMTWQDIFSDDAVEKITALMETYPEWPEPYVMMALYWMTHSDAEGFEENALASVEAAKAVSDENDFMLSEIEATIQFNAGNHAEAEELFLEMVELVPQAKNPYRYLHLMYVEQGRYDEALSIVKRAQRIYPLEYEFLRSEHEIYIESGNESELLEMLVEAWELWTDAEYEDALDSFREAAEFASENDGVSDFDEAYALYALQHFSRTWAVYDTFVAYSDEAMEATEDMLELIPDWDLPHLVMARLLLSLEEEDDALEVLDKAIEAFPNSSELYFERGWLLKELNEFESATADFWRYAELVNIRQVDYSRFTLLNDSNRIPISGGWSAVYDFETEADAELRFTALAPLYDDYLLILLDENGQPLAADEYLKALGESDELALNLEINVAGQYSLYIICLDWNWFPNSVEVEITLE